MKRTLFALTFCHLLILGCSDDGASSLLGLCGNSAIDDAETCDDGNIESGDGCSSSCQVEDGYRCDSPGQACSVVSSLCGNGVLNGEETCDDGNHVSGDGCSSSCELEEGYICQRPGVPCVSLAEALCGNHALDEGETCDDGNRESGDGCSSLCQLEEGYTCSRPGERCVLKSCGNGIVDEGEVCDDGIYAQSYGAGACDETCRFSHYCGDGLWDEIDREYGEECDDGRDTSENYNGCTENCKRIVGRYCGDRLMTHNETCDDGNGVAGDGCSAECTVEKGWYCPELGQPCKRIEAQSEDCGNDRLDVGETCDDGNTESGDGCSAACQTEAGWVCDDDGKNCRQTVCGDSVVEGSETCDDGNTASGDGCDALCHTEAGWLCQTPGAACIVRACGDGVAVGDEACDDGNNVSGDGCSAFCQRETGYACPTTGGACYETVCGDGKVEGDETCDEGKSEKTGGCASCQIVMGWECKTPGAPCTQTATFGNGILEGAEQCDEGHLSHPENQTPGCKNGIISAGYRCPTPGAACIKGQCGDGERDAGEECDDGNLLAGDGCDPLCKRETMFSCSSSGACKPICGDGITIWEAGEECDDGNQISGDGCSADCKKEVGFICTEFSNDYPETIQLPVTYRDFRGYNSRDCKNVGNTPKDGCIDNQMEKLYKGTFKAGHGHPDFENVNASEQNMVKATLGIDGIPVFNKGDQTKVTKTSFDMWYRDYPGINQTIKEHLTLYKTATPGVYQMDSAAFFPLTGRGYGNDTQDYNQNFHFTSHIQTYFKYTGKAEKLSFTGDDDVWVFVNGKRAIDLGGCHSATSADFTLSAAKDSATGHYHDTTYNLYEGGIYPISFFHAERHTGASNFKLTLAGFVNMGTASCSAVCGDGLVRGDEECDIAGHVDDEVAKQSGCVQCKITPVCGNGKIEGSEACDTDESWCQNCQLLTCGNGIIDAHETCDDGDKNGTDASTCLKNCRLKGCGNGIIDPGEACDNGEYNGQGNCTEKCTIATCGDGIVQPWLGEICDDGINDGAYGHCGLGCSYLSARCGDGIVDTIAGETCDDGINNGAYGTCSETCQRAPYCGDGIIQPEYESCDDGDKNGTSETKCSYYCRFTVN